MRAEAIRQPRLHVDADAPLDDGRPVLVLLHGFTQTGRTWDAVRDGLRRVGPTVAVDLIGHGRSPRPQELAPYRMESCVAQVEAALERLGLPAAWLVGYSMGGRVALQVAVHRPRRVQGLVLLSTTAGFSDPATRAERVKADAVLAERIPAWGVEAFVDYWLDLPLFEGLRRLPPPQWHALRQERLRNDPAALANALRGMGTGAMVPLWPHLRDVDVPALVMAGELDEKFVGLARSLAAALPQGNLSVLPDVGHAGHLEAPRRFVQAVSTFFERLRAA